MAVPSDLVGKATFIWISFTFNHDAGSMWPSWLPNVPSIMMQVQCGQVGYLMVFASTVLVVFIRTTTNNKFK
jgi:hypothetical protein